jgi:hypothetical protein
LERHRVSAHSGLTSATDSHGAFYKNNVDASLSLTSGISLASAVHPALVFYHRYSIDANWERVVVEDQPPPNAKARFGRVLLSLH